MRVDRVVRTGVGSLLHVWRLSPKQDGAKTPIPTKPLPVLTSIPVRLPMIQRGSDDAKLSEMCVRGAMVLSQRVWSSEAGVPLEGDLAPMVDDDADAEGLALAEQRRCRKEEAKIDKCLLQLINVRVGWLLLRRLGAFDHLQWFPRAT